MRTEGVAGHLSSRVIGTSARNFYFHHKTGGESNGDTYSAVYIFSPTCRSYEKITEHQLCYSLLLNSKSELNFNIRPKVVAIFPDFLDFA